MKIIQIDLAQDNSEVINEAAHVLEQGGVVVYPTDVGYGLGANALNPFAIERVFRIKNRPAHKPLPILVRNLTWVEGLAYLSPRVKEMLAKVWPGKVTVVLPKREVVPNMLTGGIKTVGIRVTDFPFVDALLVQLGYPITSTSANISGGEAQRDIAVIVERLSRQRVWPDLVIDAGVLLESGPSTVLDLTTDEPKILRVGASTPAQLMELLTLSSNDN